MQLHKHYKDYATNPHFLLKPEAHWANCWLPEVFGETWTSSGTNLLGVLSCTGNFWNLADSFCSDSTSEHAKSERAGCCPSEPLDSLISGVLVNQWCVWEVCASFFYALPPVISCSCFGALAGV